MRFRSYSLPLGLLAAACMTVLTGSSRAYAGGGSRAEMGIIPAGKFVMGSTREEREYGYKLDETLHNSSVARRNRWFENETRREVNLPAYRIDKYLVTNADYKGFADATGRPAPFVTQGVWDSYGLIHKYSAVKRFLWREGRYPPGRAAHPVVLVPHADAAAYCEWRGKKEGRKLRLPTEEEWEKAARGADGRYFPWGNVFDAARLNSYDGGPFDTVPVGRYPSGASPSGILDMAGMVFEWTWTRAAWDPGKFIVKGGSWDDYPGVTRSAARHGRPSALKHILIGFRCAGPVSPE
ncbi:MAG: formylglycine-generating enzyme family protein [Nitrospinota bacterium]